MNKFYPLSVLFLFLFSCGVSEQEYNKLKAELEECKSVVADLQNTPQNRLFEIQNLLKDDKFDLAKQKLSDFSEKFADSKEFKEAEKAIIDLETKIEQEKKEAERKKALGFNILKETPKVEVGGLILDFSDTKIQNQWTFDNYGNGSYYRKAERGNSYLTTKVSITSEEKNPSLYPVLAYYLVDGELKLIDQLRYKFVKWKDYGAYLGNHSDYSNDFAHTKKIPFTCGLEISNELLSYPIYLVVRHSGCIYRDVDRFKEPSVQYKNGASCDIPKILKVEDFDFTTLVKVIKK